MVDLDWGAKHGIRNSLSDIKLQVLPSETTENKTVEEYLDCTPIIQNMPVNIIIVSPQSGDVVQLNEHGTAEIRGYAVPQGSDEPVMNVEVSVDDFKTWNVAKLGMEHAGKWCWVIWKLRINIPVGEKKCIFSCAAKKLAIFKSLFRHGGSERVLHTMGTGSQEI